MMQRQPLSAVNGNSSIPTQQAAKPAVTAQPGTAAAAAAAAAQGGAAGGSGPAVAGWQAPYGDAAQQGLTGLGQPQSMQQFMLQQSMSMMMPPAQAAHPYVAAQHLGPHLGQHLLQALLQPMPPASQALLQSMMLLPQPTPNLMPLPGAVPMQMQLPIAPLPPMLAAQLAAAQAAAASTAATLPGTGLALVNTQQEHEEELGDAEDEEQQDGGGGEEQQEWQAMLWDALHAAAPPRRFACSGRLDSSPMPFLCPRVSVSGVGQLGLPLSIEQATTLRAAAQQAPYGKGLRTVVDTAVRDAYQVDASQVVIGPCWQPVLQTAVSEVARVLDINDAAACSIQARLYKLLLYQQGGHFSAHQDTEKEQGMIGTLVVQLPCCGGHTGGRLTVRHKDVAYTHHFSQDSATSLQYAAFFADCEHELSSITSGMRLVLVYNLVWVGALGTAPRLYKTSPAEVKLSRALTAWQAEIDAGGRQKRIALLLEHQYTEANLRFEHLKGADRAMARALSTCAAIDAHLVLVTRRVSGTTTSPWGGRKRNKRCRWYDDFEDEDEGPHTMGEVYDTTERTSDWIAQDGTAINYGSIDPEIDFYHPEDWELFGSDDEPDSEEYQGYTGNAGPTLDHVYRRTLLVLWPRSQALGEARRAGFPALLSLHKRRIADAAAQQPSNGQHQVGPSAPASGQSSVGSSSAGLKSHAEALAVLQACVQDIQRQPIQAAQPAYRLYGTHNTSSSRQQVPTVLQLGTRAVQLGVQGAAEAVQQLLAAVASWADGLADPALSAAVTAAAGVLDATAVGPCLQQLVTRCMVSQPNSCIKLLQGVSRQPELQQQLASAALSAAPVVMVDTLLSLAVSVPGLPALQQQVVDKLTAAVQQDQSAQLAGNVAAAVHKLQQLPQLQQQLATAAATMLCAAGPMAHYRSIVQLLRACQGQEQLREQLVAAVCSALRGSGTAAWQVSGVTGLLEALLNDRPAQQQVLAAVAQSMFSNAALLQAQTDDSMVTLSGLLLQEPELAATHYPDFAAAVAGRPNNHNLLMQLLQSGPVAADAAARGLLVGAVAAALPVSSSWQVSSLMTLLGLLEESGSQQQQLKDAMVQGLFANSNLLSSQTADSMLQLSNLLLSNAVFTAAHYAAFAGAVAQRPVSTKLLMRLLQSASVASSTSAKAALIRAAAAPLRTGADVWQVAEAVQLTGALQGVPTLQQTWRAAIAESVFTKSTLLARQTEQSMAQLSTMLLADVQLQAAYYDRFAAAVIQRPDNYKLLKQLLQSGPVRASLDCPEVQQLVSCQVKNLEGLSAVPPFSWAMPEASLHSWPQVEEFLRGPQQVFTLTGFSGIAEARRAATDIEGRSFTYFTVDSGACGARYETDHTGDPSTYSLTAEATGTGRYARVIVTKTPEWFQRNVQGKEVYKQELQAVRALQR